MESLTSLVAFVHAAEQQSFVAAAQLAGATPSAIAKAVARLEARLDVRLLRRTTRSMSLTEEGEVFYERCKRILDDLADAEATMLHSRSRPAGRLRITMPQIVGHHLFLPILPAFVASYPEIKLDIDFEDRVTDLVAEGIDVGIRSGELADSGLIARVLGRQHFVVCGAPAYLERRGRPLTPADLAHHDCIHFRYPSSGRIAPWSFEPPEIRPVLPRSLVFNNTDAGLRAAVIGLGLAHLPVYVAEPYIASGALVPVLTQFMAPFGALSLVWPAQRRLSPKIRVFVDHVAAAMAAQATAFRAVLPSAASPDRSA